MMVNFSTLGFWFKDLGRDGRGTLWLECGFLGEEGWWEVSGERIYRCGWETISMNGGMTEKETCSSQYMNWREIIDILTQTSRMKLSSPTPPYPHSTSQNTIPYSFPLPLRIRNARHTSYQKSPVLRPRFLSTHPHPANMILPAELSIELNNMLLEHISRLTQIDAQLVSRWLRNFEDSILECFMFRIELITQPLRFM